MRMIMISTEDINSKYVMRFLSLLFLIFCCLTCQVQAQKLGQLAEYFQTVHQAAVAVCKGEMDVAKTLYSSAIKNSSYNYTVDLNNAIYAEVHSEKPDTARIIYYLQKLQKKGICVHKKYERFPKFKPYAELVKEVNCNIVKNNTDRLLLEELLVADQAMRDSMIKYPNSLETQQKLYAVDSANYQQVSKILDRALLQNIPLDEYIGTDGRFNVSVIVFHYSEQRFDAPKIFKLVEAGILDPRDVSVNFDESIERGYIPNLTKTDECKWFQPFGTTTTIQTLKEIIIKIPPETCLLEINEFRKKYYLPDVIEECKIKAYAQYNRKNGFSYRYSNLSFGKQSLEEFEQKILKKYKIIKYKDENDYDFNQGY